MTRELRLGPLPQVRNSTEETYTLSTGVPFRSVIDDVICERVSINGVLCERVSIDGVCATIDGQPVYMEV